ncbi:hypothetical protein HZQ57_15940 [Elizabethkingia anophelis]|nr:hypothetical protein [Elizabethkingia anophelis]MCT3813892.1 hypothetical protein [Elizabethkingia anophelis]MCT3820986.1 hypothetical protein [Elizabethkingia anophelis]
MTEKYNNDFLEKKIKIMRRGMYVYLPLFGVWFIFSFLAILQKKSFIKLYFLIPIFIYVVIYRGLYYTNNMLSLINKIVNKIQIVENRIIIDTYGGLWNESKRYRFIIEKVSIAENNNALQNSELTEYMKYSLKTMYNNKQIELFLSEEKYKTIKNEK